MRIILRSVNNDTMELLELNGDIISTMENWRRIKNRDTSLTELVIRLNPTGPIIGDAEIEELGRDIGSNTHHLRKLLFQLDSGDEIHEKMQKFRLVCEGINNNQTIQSQSSIQSFSFDRSRQLGGKVLQHLFDFLMLNNNLQEIDMGNGLIINCEEMISFAWSLAWREHPLRRLFLWNNNIDDDLVEKLVTPFRQNARLTPKKIDLRGNNIGQRGCESIAKLLQDPACAMEELSLVRNRNINNDSATTIFANALENNKSLVVLELDGTSVTSISYRPFLRVVCNKTSINATYMSNHSLQVVSIGPPRYEMPGRPPHDFKPEGMSANLQQYLQLNMNPDKRYVARRKVLMNHFSGNINMKPFEEMAPELLMRAINFLDTCDQESREEYADARCSIIFQLIKSDPMMICKD